RKNRDWYARARIMDVAHAGGQSALGLSAVADDEVVVLVHKLPDQGRTDEVGPADDQETHRELTPRFARVILHVRRRFARRIEAWIVNRGADCHFQRHDSGPGREGIVFLVVDGRAGADFGGELLDGEAQDRSLLQFAFVGLASVVPTAGDD